MLKTPARTPVANAICERVMGTMRRECLDVMIPLNERHLYRILTEWMTHYNEGRPHKSLGPGIPQPRSSLPVSRQVHRHQLPIGQRVVARVVLGGLHHQDHSRPAPPRPWPRRRSGVSRMAKPCVTRWRPNSTYSTKRSWWFGPMGPAVVAK